MKQGEKKPRDAPRDEAPDGGPAFQDDLTGRVTLSLDGPPLVLPEELAGADSSVRCASQPPPQHLDAWSADRLRRSSLPPASSQLSSALPPPIPANDTLHAQEVDEGDEGDLLALVGRARPAMSLDLVTEMTERFALGDYSGALRAAELVLGQDPSHGLGQHYARESELKLTDMYTSQLSGGALRTVVQPAELAWLGLDPQVASLLAQVDGQSDYETLLARSGMPRLWALRALVELLGARVIRLV